MMNKNLDAQEGVFDRYLDLEKSLRGSSYKDGFGS